MYSRLIHRVGWGVLLIIAALAPCQAEEKPATSVGWINVTANVGGEKWGYAGVTTLAAVPGSDHIIAGVSESGLWATADAGKTWKKIGDKSPVPIQNRPYQILFDPKNPKIFWESGSDKGPGLFRTDDAGETFSALGSVARIDAVGVDFTDPQRQTLLVGHHEESRNVEKSADAGKTWQNIGAALPDHINFTGDVIVIDAHTFLVSAAGWKQENGKQLPFGIYRSADAGATWTKVADAGAQGPACVTSDGVIYWQTLWAAGLIKSIDQGKNWEKLPGPVKSNPIELPGKKLLAPLEKQLTVSADAGKTWQPWGPDLPFKPSGIIYNEKQNALYAWRSTETKEDAVIVRWDLPG